MVMKKKNKKKLDKVRQKATATKEEINQTEVDFDTSAYVVYNNLEFTYPCLSFDIVKDSLGEGPERVKQFPLSFHMVAGSQVPQHVEANFLYVAKVDNLHPLKQEEEGEEVDNEEEDEDEPEDPKKLPRLSTIKIPIKGCANRVRSTTIGGKTYTATWTDKAKVHIHDITIPLQAVSNLRSIQTYIGQKVENKAVFTFGGHLEEGYAIDWSPVRHASVATGDCKKNIHVWTPKSHNDWLVDQHPLVGHENSVEDIKWSPKDQDILSSCSVDKSIRLWDLRLSLMERCTVAITNSHRSDVNVIDWNKHNNNLIVSGGDDGVVKVWDLRSVQKSNECSEPVAQFSYHKKPITSVEWNPNDESVVAISSEDDKLTVWDLAVERDEEQELADAATMEVDSEESQSSDQELEDEDGVEYPDLKEVPEQMLFLHQGQVEVKELHWHPQLEGLIISSALNGINIIKTISA